MYNEEKDDLKIWLLNNITDLLVDENTKSEERKVLGLSRERKQGVERRKRRKSRRRVIRNGRRKRQGWRIIRI